MLNFMKKCVEATTSNLSSNVRNLLFAAYKNVMGASRAAWRVICCIEGSKIERTPHDLNRIAIIKVKSI